MKYVPSPFARIALAFFFFFYFTYSCNLAKPSSHFGSRKQKNNSKKWIANFQRLEIRYNFTGEFVLHVMFVVHGDSSSPNPN
jgi:hypothetical protein